PGDARGRAEGAFLDPFADQLSVHHQQSLWNCSAPAVELVLTIIAVTRHEFIFMTVANQPNENVRLRVDCGDRRSRQYTAGHLFGPQARERKDRPCLLLRFTDFVIGGAIEAKDFGTSDEPHQAAEIIAMCSEIVG